MTAPAAPPVNTDILNGKRVSNAWNQWFLGIAKQSSSASSSASWSNISGKPTSFNPSEHTHSVSDITGLGDSVMTKVLRTLQIEATTGTVDLGDLFEISSITFTGFGRFRLYRNAAFRDDDLERNIEKDPTPGDGLIAEFYPQGKDDLVWALSPLAKGATYPSGGLCAWSWDGPIGVTVYIDHVQMVPDAALITAYSQVAGPSGANGAAGADGRTILYGDVDPTAEDGADGDSYINTATNCLFGPKASGVWPGGVSLVGPSGATGPQGPSGATGPQGPTGATGPQGAQGETGPQGATGPTGPQGEAGAQGIQGATGAAGATGATGAGVPAGGTTGQVATKNSAADYDIVWVTPSCGGSTKTFRAVKTWDFAGASLPSDWTIYNTGLTLTSSDSGTTTTFTTSKVNAGLILTKSMNPSACRVWKFRVKLVSGTWYGITYFADALNTSYSGSYYFAVPAPSSSGAWVDIYTADLFDGLTAGTDTWMNGGAISSLRFHLVQESGAQFVIDYVSVGVME